MAGESTGAWQNAEKALTDLAALRHFNGSPAEFWPAFLASALDLTGADKLTLLIRPAPGQAWRRMLEWPAQPEPSRLFSIFAAQIEDFAGRAFSDGRLTALIDPKDRSPSGNFSIGSRIVLPQAEDCVILGVISEVNERAARGATVRLGLAASVPEFYQSSLAARQNASKVERLTSALDLSVSVGGENRFFPTALIFCNRVAAQFKCDRVSIGWLERGIVRLRAVSRMEVFDRQMTAAQGLEMAMEEAMDQDDEIIWPVPPAATFVARDHAEFAAREKAGHLCSLPLRVGERAVGIVTCER